MSGSKQEFSASWTQSESHDSLQQKMSIAAHAKKALLDDQNIAFTEFTRILGRHLINSSDIRRGSTAQREMLDEMVAHGTFLVEQLTNDEDLKEHRAVAGLQNAMKKAPPPKPRPPSRDGGEGSASTEREVKNPVWAHKRYLSKHQFSVCWRGCYRVQVDPYRHACANRTSYMLLGMYGQEAIDAGRGLFEKAGFHLLSPYYTRHYVVVWRDPADDIGSARLSEVYDAYAAQRMAHQGSWQHQQPPY